MTYIDLARVYLQDDGIGEATYLVHFAYRKGKTKDDVAAALMKAEARIKTMPTRDIALARSEIGFQLGRVLKQRKRWRPT